MTQQNLAALHVARAAHDTCTTPEAALQLALRNPDAALTVVGRIHMGFEHAKATRLRAAFLETLDGHSGDTE